MLQQNTTTDRPTFAACQMALEKNMMFRSDRVMPFVCETGLTYPMSEVTTYIDRRQPINCDTVAAA